MSGDFIRQKLQLTLKYKNETLWHRFGRTQFLAAGQ